jgi:hypothetical protein
VVTVSNGENVPLSVLCGIQPTWVSQIAIGSNKILPPKPTPGYWFVVVDLTNLAVSASVVSTDGTTVPPDVQPYLGQANKLLIFMTMVTSFNQVPQGALFAALKSVGAGVLLDRAEQINTTLGTGHFSYFGYILVATTDTGDSPGFEEFSFSDSNAVLTIQLMPITVDGNTIYTPIALH